ncbi:MAG: DUF5719 family protein [Mycetocola sp.]
MADRRRIAVTSGRVISGVIGVAVALASVVAVGRLDLPVIAVDAPNAVVTPTASDQSRVCPGPLLRQGDDASSGGAAAAFGAAQSTIAADGDVQQTSLSAPDNVSGDQFGLPTLVSAASASDQTSPPLAVAQSQVAGLEDVTGFAATACPEASADSWLVGGSSDVGRTTVLSLSNPTRTDAVVDLTFYSETGEIDAPGARGIIVNAGEQRLFSLASFAPEARIPVVRVQTTGGQVAAVLQQSIIRGITPGGIELSSPTAPPATDQVISGVVVPSSSPEGDGENYDDSAAAVRLFVPGTDPAQVTLTFAAEQGDEAPLPISYEFEGGIVSELSLANLPSGSFGLSISSDVPVVAAARTTATADESVDFAWFGASGAVADETTIAVAPGQSPRLHLFNPTGSDAIVVLTDPAGKETSVTVPSDSAVARTVDATAYDVQGADGIHAQISYEGADGFSAYAIQPANPAASPVTVYPR